MNPRRVRRLLGSALVAVLASGSAGCGSSPITSARIEGALAPTFANLVRLQISRVGLAAMAASDLAARASCQKLLSQVNEGSGQWVCTVIWQDHNHQGQSDTFDLFVTTDGCYTATVSSETLGGPTVRTTEGREVRNLLYSFEGCFTTM